MIRNRSTAEIIKRNVARLIYYSGIYYILNIILRRNHCIYILAYHRIIEQSDKNDYVSTLGTYKDELEKQVSFISKSSNVIDLDEAVRILNSKEKISTDYFVITLDDGYLDNLTLGVPVFQKYEVPAIVYITNDFIGGGSFLWHDLVEYAVANTEKKKLKIDCYNFELNFMSPINKSDTASKLKSEIKKMKSEEIDKAIRDLFFVLQVEYPEENILLLGWEDIKTLKEYKIDIGAHTNSHMILKKENYNFFDYEIVNCKSLIFDRVGIDVKHFAYPDGQILDIDSSAEILVRETYSSAVTTEPGINKQGDDVYRLKRIGVINEMDIVYFKVKLLASKLISIIK